MQIMTPEHLDAFWNRRLKGSMIVVSPPYAAHSDENSLFAKMKILKLFKKPISTEITIRYNKDRVVTMWFADFPIGNVKYRISGITEQYDTEIYNKIQEYIGTVCQNVTTQFFKGSEI